MNLFEGPEDIYRLVLSPTGSGAEPQARFSAQPENLAVFALFLRRFRRFRLDFSARRRGLSDFPRTTRHEQNGEFPPWVPPWSGLNGAALIAGPLSPL